MLSIAKEAWLLEEHISVFTEMITTTFCKNIDDEGTIANVPINYLGHRLFRSHKFTLKKWLVISIIIKLYFVDMWGQ